MSERQAKSVDWAMKVQASRSGGVFYWAVRGLLRLTLLPWLRVTVEGTEHLDTPGPVILAPVHRSNLDSILVACTRDVGFEPSARNRCSCTRSSPGRTQRWAPSRSDGARPTVRR